MPKTFHRTRHTWLLYLAYAVFGYIVNCPGPVTPFLKAEFALSYTVSSLHFSAYAIGMIMASLIGYIVVGRLSFHGCISTAGALAYGTPAQVRQDVQDTLDVMMPASSYMLSPTHAIQDHTPTENAVAMYDVAKELGWYPVTEGQASRR